MASTIKIKNSSTAGAVPGTGDLVQGELAINVTDRRIFTENASGTVVELGTPSIDDNGNATAITIDSSENVGIGTSSPSTYGKIVSYGSFPATGGGYSGMSVVDTTSGSGLTNVFNGSNFTDADFFVKITQVGASSKYALLGPSTNIPLALMTNNTERARIDTSGNLLVGTTSVIQTGKISQTGGSFAGTNAGAVFDGGRLTSNGDIAYFRSTTGLAGYITITGANTCTYNSVSDVRLKENIVDAPSALTKVESLQVRSFDWKDGTGAVPYGFIAQELNEVVPEAVSHGTTNEDGSMITPWGIDTSLLVPYLTKAIQEQQALITTLTDRITALEAK